MLNHLINQTKEILQPIPPAYKKEFLAELDSVNHSRMHTAIWVMIIYTAFILISDFTMKDIWHVTNWTLFVKMDILFALVTGSCLIIYKSSTSGNTLSLKMKGLIYFLPLFLLVWSSVIAGTEYSYSEGFPTYIIILFIISTSFYLRLGIHILYIAASLMALFANIFATYEVDQVILARYFTLIPMVILALVVSRILFLAKVNDLLNKRKIEEMNKSLFLAKDNLEERVKEKTKELRNTTEQYKKAKEQAEESDRLKTAFLRNMSHEFRTPLHTIIGFASLLNEFYRNEPEQTKYIRFIIQKGDELLHMAENILQFSKIESGKEKIEKEEVSLNHLIYKMKESFELTAGEKNVDLIHSCNLSDNSSNIYTDKDKLERILINLLNNALKYTNHGSVEFGYKVDYNDIRFFVKDTGIGIEPVNREKVFERFWHMNDFEDEHFAGIGLGLSVCKAYIQLLNGEIWFDSKPGEGTSFFFTIPYEAVEN